MDLNGPWPDDGTGSALRKGRLIEAGPALSRKEKGWGGSLATVPSPASWDSAAGRIGQPTSGLPYGRVALSLVQSLEARSFGRLEKRRALD